ncbi:hypothetical protein NDU88_004849 [Pleurodeles waltl]|uniref:Uncharacterized protein n=1 Tax=Pleurodeles waltl TaxID=8319 RepID=A0AAV7VHE0_PLEWA|nr:hypothetical protein NDU88_004849 [Pleurodeles waltl]
MQGAGRGRATKQDGRLERELRAETVQEGQWGREDSRTTHRVRCPSTPTTAATQNHVRGSRRSGTQGRKLATRPRPIRPGKRGGVASSEDRGRRACSGKEQAEQAAGTAGATTTRIHLPTTPTNTRGPSTPHRETGRRSKGVRPLRQPGEKPGQRGRIESLQNKNGIAGGRGTTPPLFSITEGQQNPPAGIINSRPPLQTANTEEGRGAQREARGGEETRGVSDWRGIGDEESQREPREQRYRRRERTGTSVRNQSLHRPLYLYLARATDGDSRRATHTPAQKDLEESKSAPSPSPPQLFNVNH